MISIQTFPVNVAFSIDILQEHGNLVYYARIFTPELRTVSIRLTSFQNPWKWMTNPVNQRHTLQHRFQSICFLALSTQRKSHILSHYPRFLWGTGKIFLSPAPEKIKSHLTAERLDTNAFRTQQHNLKMYVDVIHHRANGEENMQKLDQRCLRWFN